MLKINTKNIPNYLTILRLILVPIIFSLVLTEHYLLASFFFIIANISDIFDGRIARKYKLITEWGSLMDPLADKIIQISTITALIIKNIIPFWILLVITLKELIMISVGFFLYRKKNTKIRSKWYGKLATFLLFVAIFSSLLSKNFLEFASVTIYLYYIALSVAVFAGLLYGKNLILLFTKKKRIT